MNPTTSYILILNFVVYIIDIFCLLSKHKQKEQQQIKWEYNLNSLIVESSCSFEEGARFAGGGGNQFSLSSSSSLSISWTDFPFPLLFSSLLFYHNHQNQHKNNYRKKLTNSNKRKSKRRKMRETKSTFEIFLRFVDEEEESESSV